MLGLKLIHVSKRGYWDPWISRRTIQCEIFVGNTFDVTDIPLPGVAFHNEIKMEKGIKHDEKNFKGIQIVKTTSM